jgi:adenosylmethionine-8-amino-7-oxononanoate aminotransferase
VCSSDLVKDKETRESFTPQESEKILRGFISQALFENGIYCRTDDRGDPVVQLAPALIANETQFDEIEAILRTVLIKANSMI